MKTQDTLATLRPGCYIDESAGSSDDLNERIVAFAQDYGFTEIMQGEPDEEPDEEQEDSAVYSHDDWSDDINTLADEAVDWLNEQESRPYIFWSVEENSLFLAPSVESAKEDCDFVSSRSQEYPEDDYRGEWLHVSDHGNATLYVRNEDGSDTEIWGVV